MDNNEVLADFQEYIDTGFAMIMKMTESSEVNKQAIEASKLLYESLDEDKQFDFKVKVIINTLEAFI